MAIESTLYKSILDAMQPAEDLGGPEYPEYIGLMDAVAAEASKRAATARALMVDEVLDDPLITEFCELDRAMASMFAERAGLWGDHVATIESCESDHDQLAFGCWTITKIKDTRTVHSIRGARVIPCITFVCEAEVTTPSNSRWEPDDTDAKEFARCASLFDALKACALAEKDWEFDHLNLTPPATI